MRRRALKNRSVVQEPTLNLTPLIDVVFVILIMFIVIAPLLELDRVELAAGPMDAADGALSLQESGPIAIHVHKDNTVWLNTRMIRVKELKDLLTQEKMRYPNARPQLFHDKNALFGTYQSIKNAVEAAGFYEMDVILSENNE